MESCLEQTITGVDQIKIVELKYGLTDTDADHPSEPSKDDTIWLFLLLNKDSAHTSPTLWL